LPSCSAQFIVPRSLKRQVLFLQARPFRRQHICQWGALGNHVACSAAIGAFDVATGTSLQNAKIPLIEGKHAAHLEGSSKLPFRYGSQTDPQVLLEPL